MFAVLLFFFCSIVEGPLAGSPFFFNVKKLKYVCVCVCVCVSVCLSVLPACVCAGKHVQVCLCM